MIAIIVAMDAEISKIVSLMNQVTLTKLHNIDIYIGTLGAKEVIVAKCGVGKINAAHTTTTILDKYPITKVISTGISGGYADLNTLDVVVADRVCQHDVDTTALGDPLGMVSGCNRIFFESDADVLANVRKSFPNIFIGTVASGDQFVASSAKIAELHTQFGAISCEMESGAVGQICHLRAVPFTVIRVISDKADEVSPLSFEMLKEQASSINARMVAQIVSLI